jgi:hypothetical protein
MAMSIFHSLYRFCVAVIEVIDEAMAMRALAHSRNPGLAASE